MLKPYYVYRHIRPDTLQVFYIGKGKNRRQSHLYERAHAPHTRNSHWQRVVRKNGGSYTVEIVMEFASHAECVAKEIELIRLYGRVDLGRGHLVNKTDGGEGSLGIIVSDKLRELRRRIVSGFRHPNFGKKLSKETCRRKSEATMGAKHHLFGKRLPQGWKSNIRSSKMGEKNPFFGKPTPLSRKVKNTKTGVVYDSVARAAKAEGVNVKTLYQYLDGSRPNKTDLVKI